MAEELKIVIDAEVDGAINGVNKFKKSIEGLTTGSIAQLQKASMLLRTQLANLSPAALKSDFGRQLSESLKIVTAELKTLQTESGITAEKTSGAFEFLNQKVKKFATAIPNLAVSAGIGFVTSAVLELASSFFKSGEAAEESALKSKAAYDKLAESIATVKSNIGFLIDEIAFANKLGAINVQIRGQGNLQDLREQSIAQLQLTQDLARQTREAKKITEDALDQRTAAIVEGNEKSIAAASKGYDEALKLLREAQAKEEDSRQTQRIIFRQIALQKIKDAEDAAKKEEELRGKSLAAFEKFQAETIARAKAFEKEFKGVFVLPDLEISFTNTKDKVFNAAQKLLSDIQKGLLQLVLLKEVRQINIPIELGLQVDDKGIANDIQKIRDNLFKDANIFGDNTKIIKGIVPGVSDDVNKRNKEFFDAFQKDIQATAGLVTDVLAPAFGDMFDAIAAGENPLKAFFHGIEQSINQLIKKLIAAAIQAAVLSALSGGASGSLGGFSKIFGNLLGFSGAANFGGVGGSPFSNIVQIVGSSRISGNDIVTSYSRTTNSNSRFGG